MSDYYRHWLKRLIYTAGVKHVADEAGAHWLLDAICSHLPNPKLKGHEFMVWKLDVKPNRTARLWVTDGDSDTAILEQAIEYSDFPEPHAEFYVVRTPGQPDVLMLPCEY